MLEFNVFLELSIILKLILDPVTIAAVNRHEFPVWNPGMEEKSMVL